VQTYVIANSWYNGVDNTYPANGTTRTLSFSPPSCPTCQFTYSSSTPCYGSCGTTSTQTQYWTINNSPCNYNGTNYNSAQQITFNNMPCNTPACPPVNCQGYWTQSCPPGCGQRFYDVPVDFVITTEPQGSGAACPSPYTGPCDSYELCETSSSDNGYSDYLWLT